MANHAHFAAESHNEAYDQVMRFFNSEADEQASQFGKTREILNCFIEIRNPRRRFVLSPQRRHSLDYVCGEMCWYFSGERSVARAARYSKFWEHLADEDGNVNSNYGDKIFYRRCPNPMGGKSQFEYVVDELRRDRDSRRAVMFLMLPEDYHKMHTTRDYPCTMSLHFFVRRGKLDLIVHMRSNDFVLGFNNDMPFFSVLQEMVAVEVGVPLGTYYHNSDSMHLYERNYGLLGYQPTPGNEWRETPFPDVTRADVEGIAKWAGFEDVVRADPAGAGELTRFCPPFTRTVFDQIARHWRNKQS